MSPLPKPITSPITSRATSLCASNASRCAHVLLCLLVSVACSEEPSGPQVLRDPVAAEAGKASFEWMTRRVELMVAHKADCVQMAEQLIEDDKLSASQRAQWRSVKAQEWLIARSASDFEFQKRLSEVITRGDLVFSFCAFFEDFRARLKP